MMINLKLILLLLILQKHIKLSCSTGTLKCSNPDSPTQSKSLICDPLSNFVLDENRCIPQSIPNCLISLEPNKCKVCKYDYYLTNDRQCAKVPKFSPSEIKGCNFYLGINECQACNLNTYQRNGLCRPIVNSIDSCSLMEDVETCQICDLKLPSYNKTYCQLPNKNTLENCLFVRHPVGLYNIPSCTFSYVINNCDELDFDNKCKKCSHGYILSSDKSRCFVKPSPPLNPKIRIPNCFKFASENYEVCEICYEGYYLLNSNTKCVKHEATIDGCNVYSQTSADKCIFCSNKKYLNGGSCLDRDRFFSNCEKYSRTSDKCLNCAENHIFHYDNKRCSLKITDCKTHKTTYRILQCENCIDSHYLNNDDTLCFNANNAINGCQKFAKGPSCGICKEGFYLDTESKTCFYHGQYINCKNMSVTTKNVCDKCENEGIRTVKTHECNPVTTNRLEYYENLCAFFDSNQNCKRCLTDYVLKDTTFVDEETTQEVTDKKCQLEKGCLEWEDNDDIKLAGCKSCESSYFMYDNQCNKADTDNCMYSYETAVTKYSLIAGNNLEGGFPCEICSDKRLFTVKTSDPENRCIKSSFFLPEQIINNCLSYEKVNGNYICKFCQRNFKLDTNNNLCEVIEYSATETAYANNEDRITTATYTNTVKVKDPDTTNFVTKNWPLTDIPLKICGILGPGGKYCLELRDEEITTGTNPNEVTTTYSYAPLFNMNMFANYTEEYIIGDHENYEDTLELNISNILTNFTEYKKYLNPFDANQNRKDQEPYFWYDTMPVSEAVPKNIAKTDSNIYKIPESQTDWKRVYIIKNKNTDFYEHLCDPAKNADFASIPYCNLNKNLNRYYTVCNKSIFSLTGNDALWKQDFTTLKIVLNSVNILNDYEVPGENDGDDPISVRSPFKDIKTMWDEELLTSYVYPCDSNKAITNCVFDDNYIFSEERLIPFVSCNKCSENYAVRMTLWLYKGFIGDSINKYHHYVAETDCVLEENSPNNNDKNLIKVENCYYYERKLHHVNNDIIHYCRECSPGSYPTKTPEPPRCVPNCAEWAESLNYDGDWECDKWYNCSLKCPATVCDFETQYCDTTLEPIGCVDHTCCYKDENGDCMETPPSYLECNIESRYRWVRTECLNNCQNEDGQDVGLSCEEETKRCIPKVCDTLTDDQRCVAGIPKPKECYDCLSDSTVGKYCKMEGVTGSCVDFNYCDNANPDGATEPVLTCPPEEENCTSETCTLANMLVGNADKVFCNYTSGNCVVTHINMNYVCHCKTWTVKNLGIYNDLTSVENYYERKCVEFDLETTADNPCLCLGTTGYQNLDKCPTDTVPPWHGTNEADECHSAETFLASSTFNVPNKCGLNHYKHFRDEKTQAEAAANPTDPADPADRVERNKVANENNNIFKNKRILNAGAGGAGGAGGTNICHADDGCYNNTQEITDAFFTLKSTADTNFADGTWIGGCLLVCLTRIAPDPTFEDSLPNDTDKENCFNSCDTDGGETCVGSVPECKTQCQGIILGADNQNGILSTGCQKYEICQQEAGQDPICVPRPCDPPCNENYETCNQETNTCTLKAIKPVIERISTCTMIENCDKRYHLNKCYKCLNLFSFQVAATGNTKENPNVGVPQLTPDELPVCVQSNIANAIMTSTYVDAEGTTRYNVEKCDAGYVIDYNNNLCVDSVKNCKIYNLKGDCLGCDSPYQEATIQLVLGVFEKGYCLTWDELSTDEKDEITVYQEHCKYYKYEYVYTQPSEINSLSDGTLSCYQCEDNYYFNVSATPHQCVLKRTEFCKTYNTADNLATCIECEENRELKDAGTIDQACPIIENNNRLIPECSVYDTSLNCLKCNDGYSLRKTGEGSTQIGFCFKNLDDDSCLTFNASTFETNAEVGCYECAKVQGIFYYSKVINTPINTCIFIAPRRLCTKHDYDIQNSLDLTNTFVCLECESDYYLGNGLCIRRINSNIKNCIEYKISADECKTYQASTVASGASDEISIEIESVQTLLLDPPYSSESSETITFNGWIMGCEQYKNETACERCYAPKYINQFGFDYNTKCIYSDKTIENCIYYSDNNICSECFEGYQLIDNQCLLTTVENCATYESPNKCASCPNEYPYLDTDGNCSKDPRNLFCLIYSISNDTLNLQSTKTFECDTCIEDFYPDDSSICTQIENKIENCLYYAGDGLCKECIQGFYLSYDGKNCHLNPKFDPFCQTFSFVSECSICESGYFIDESTGKCKQCENMPSGCEYCDPINNNLCLMCKYGYTHDENGCKKTSELPENELIFVKPFRYFIENVVTAQSGVDSS